MKFINTNSMQKYFDWNRMLIGDGEISLWSPAPPLGSSSSMVVCSLGRACSSGCVCTDDSGWSQGPGHNAKTGCSLGPLCHGAPSNHLLFAD